LDLPVVNHQAAQLDGMAICINEKLGSTAEGDEGVRDMKVIEAIYQSIAAGGKRTQVPS